MGTYVSQGRLRSDHCKALRIAMSYHARQARQTFPSVVGMGMSQSAAGTKGHAVSGEAECLAGMHLCMKLASLLILSSSVRVKGKTLALFPCS